MAHLVKKLMKKTSFPSNLSERCHISRPLTICFVNLHEKIPAEFHEESTHKPRKKDLSAIRLKHTDLRKVRSVVGISVTPFSIGWAKIDLKEMNLNECRSEFLNTQNEGFTETYACGKINEVKLLIPKSDLYIMESFILFTKHSQKQQNKLQIMLSSMLAVQLYDSTGPLGNDNVLFQNPSVINRLYDLLVKRERVSAGQVLQRKLGDSIAKEVGDFTITVDGVTLSTTRSTMESVFSAQPAIRDSSAVAFFIALSFVQVNFKS